MQDVAQLYGAMRPLLLRIATLRYNVPPEDAEELLHEVFLAFLLRREDVRDERAWLIGAMDHAARRFWIRSGGLWIRSAGG